MQDQELGERNPAAAPDPLERQAMLFQDFRELSAGMPRLERARAGAGPTSLVAGRGQATPAAAALLQREYGLRHVLRDDWAALPVALMPHGEGALLVLRDPGGETLRGSGPRASDTAAFLDLALRLVAAVGAMHAAGVLHRAITPDRLLLASDGRACLTGFGHAVTMSDAEAAPDHGEAAWDEDCFHYMAPELGARMNLRVDARADLYSLGCVLYELLTGRLP